MNIRFTEDKKIAILELDNIEIKETQDAIDLLGNCYFVGASKIVIKKENLIPDFFELKTGIAGEILQKFSTYQMQLAIVGDYSEINSKSLNDFIFESNKAGKITFVSSMEEALEN